MAKPQPISPRKQSNKRSWSTTHNDIIRPFHNAAADKDVGEDDDTVINRDRDTFDAGLLTQQQQQQPPPHDTPQLSLSGNSNPSTEQTPSSLPPSTFAPSCLAALSRGGDDDTAAVDAYCKMMRKGMEAERRECVRESVELDETVERMEGEVRKVRRFMDLAGMKEENVDGEYDNGSNVRCGKRCIDEGDEGTIGGIPRRFLDLSHFPQLKVSSPGETKRDINAATTSGSYNNRDILSHTIIDDETDGVVGRSGSSMCVVFAPAPQKQSTKRIHLSHAPLPHVNGTFLQEGSYNNAPLFVRVGPARKFMGLDCNVVLRRELVIVASVVGTSSSAVIGGGSWTKKTSKLAKRTKRSDAKNPPPIATTKTKGDAYIWKIGLVPAHNITHPRLIGYYFANESDEFSKHVPEGDLSSSSSTVGGTKDGSAFEASEEYYEPPVDGWRVFQESPSVKGRASTLRISYEE
ncbi:predicted protein [Thalassiosira pseudonana CCMP1335]|uniref:Uncharacterized protein n=1 Tax=Thalassiosira pseudonana TaxID=35128 RepID=B8CFN2_THAPS|nr:predicted protein [Thalassiosira pseudonana CCMP1335]EED87660.1 predicted protein [Thalassiosira pseudonana CCMP1335]